MPHLWLVVLDVSPGGRVIDLGDVSSLLAILGSALAIASLFLHLILKALGAFVTGAFGLGRDAE